MSSRHFLVAVLVAVLLAGGVVVGTRQPARAAGIGITYSVADASAAEGDAGTPGVITFTVTAGGAFFSAESVHYKTFDGTAHAGVDYVAAEGDLQFTAGGSKTVSITLVGDGAPESDETFSLKLSNNANISDDTGIATIANDDFTLSVSDTSVSEGDADTANASVQVNLSSSRSVDTTVHYQTANGTATSGQDYAAASGTVTINAGQVAKTILIPINGDTSYEDTEDFTVTLSSPSAPVTIDDGTATVTITNDDDPPVTGLPVVSIANTATAEGDNGTHTAAFTVTLSNATDHSVQVTATTSDGTAKAPGDYLFKTSTIIFPPANGPQTQSFNVTVNGDTLDEADETVNATLSSATSATIDPAATTAAMTINDDDDAPSLTVSDGQVTEGNVARFTLTLEFASGRDLSVSVATQDGTAKAPGDYTQASKAVTISAGATTGTVDVPTAQDTLDEPTEQFDLNATLEATTSVGSMQIADDDGAPSLSIADVSVAEGNNGDTQHQAIVTLAPASGQQVTVKYAANDGSATGGSTADYSVTAATLAFDPGDTTSFVSFTVHGDTTSEDNETFSITLSQPTNATISRAVSTITLTNDDAAFFRAEQVTTGAGPGGGSHVRLWNADNHEARPGFLPYRDGPGVRVARGDLDGDGHDEIVVAPGPGSPSIVQVFTPEGTGLIDQVDAYPGFQGGVFVAVGDVDGDGKGDVITSAGPGGGPHVRTFKLVGTPGSRSLQGSPGFFGARGDFTGGLTVAAGDVNADHTDEIILGTASHDQPIVYIWNYNATTNTPTQRSAPFLAYTSAFTGGVAVAAGDLDGDGKAEIVTGAGPGGGPHVRVFSGNGGGLPGSKFVYDQTFGGGVWVAIGDVNGDGHNEIITGAGPGGGPHVKAFNINIDAQPTTFFAYDEAFRGGVFVSAGRA